MQEKRGLSKMNNRCPHCGAIQSKAKLLKVFFLKKQICINCGKKYLRKINYENDQFPYLDWDVLIFGLLATVFIGNSYIWLALVLFLFFLHNFRRIELIDH